MGVLISFLKGKQLKDVFLDFQNAVPSEAEQEQYNTINQTLEQGLKVLAELEDYKGCKDVIKKAMDNPTEENNEELLMALIAAVRTTRLVYQFTLELEESVIPLLLTLSKPPEEQKQSLQTQQALAKQLARTFDFMLRFDQTRLMRPTLPNDFACYRRLLPKVSNRPEIEIKEDEANSMAMFTAEHIPMTTTVARATASACDQNMYVPEALALMANSCYSMIKSEAFQDEDVNLLCARAMTGAIVLYDHTDALGVFRKGSPIAIKDCIKLLKVRFPDQQALLNAIQFSTKHFNSATTPDSITSLFE